MYLSGQIKNKKKMTRKHIVAGNWKMNLLQDEARALVRFLHAAVVGRTQVEAFALGTRLTRITRELSSRDPDVASRSSGSRATAANETR